MSLRRLLIAFTVVALLVALPVFAATTSVYLPLITSAPSDAPIGVPSPTATGQPGTTTPNSTATIQPGATNTPTPTATVKPGATSTPSRTPGSTATSTRTPTPTTGVGATATPTPLAPSLNACQQDPNAASAPNYPVKIVAIDKGAETVTLQNVSGSTIDLSSWTMCSITGNQTHPIFGTLAPNATATFNGPAGNIWNNSQRDDGALYDPNGSLVSYLVCDQVQCP